MTTLSQHPAKPARASLWLPRAAALASATWFFLHSLWVICGPENRVMEWLYDDSFYYMITAKHFSERHISSFDGITVTSGYHPLWMWLCALVYATRGRLDLTYVRCCMALSLSISGSILLVALRHALRSRNAGLLWALALGATSYSALNNGLTVMEWPLVLLSWFLLDRLLISHAQAQAHAQSSSSGLLAAFLLGALGSFSRTDFGLIPASYLAAAIWLSLPRSHPVALRRSAGRALAATAGSAAALPLIFLYNHRMTGQWLQGSAQVKHLAATLSTPFNPVPAIWQFARVLLFLPALDLSPDHRSMLVFRGFAVLAAVLVVALAFIASRRHRLLPWARRFLCGTPAEQLARRAAVLGVAAYLLLDAFNTQATYGWYTAAVTGFMLVLAARALALVRQPVAAALVGSILGANILLAHLSGGNARSQGIEVSSGKALRRDHPQAILGGGDAGKPSFYNNGAMFNLDGLMNNEVVPYLASGRIHCYALRRHIQYLYDVGTITIPISDRERARHGNPPLPWNLYFTPVAAEPLPGMPSGPNGTLYLKTDFDAIQASGECAPADIHGNPQPLDSK